MLLANQRSHFVLRFLDSTSKKHSSQSNNFETSVKFTSAVPLKLHAAIAAIPLSGSINPQTFTQSSRRRSNHRTASAFFSPAQKLQTRKSSRELSPAAPSLSDDRPSPLRHSLYRSLCYHNLLDLSTTKFLLSFTGSARECQHRNLRSLLFQIICQSVLVFAYLHDLI